MNFIFMGFSQQSGVRRLAFERVSTGKTRTLFTVTADLIALQRFGIHLQELPLLCRRALESAIEEPADHVLALTDDQLRAHAARNAPPAPRGGFKKAAPAT